MEQEIRKKSYRRACRRAFRDGTASYRGGEITSSQAHSSLGYSSVSPPRPHSRSRPSRAATITRKPRRAGNLATALSVLSWNAGGLSAQQWHELRSGLSLAHIMRSVYKRHTGLALLMSGRAAGMSSPVAIHLRRTLPQRDRLESWSYCIRPYQHRTFAAVLALQAGHTWFTSVSRDPHMQY